MSVQIIKYIMLVILYKSIFGSHFVQIYFWTVLETNVSFLSTFSLVS